MSGSKSILEVADEYLANLSREDKDSTPARATAASFVSSAILSGARTLEAGSKAKQTKPDVINGFKKSEKQAAAVFTSPVVAKKNEKTKKRSVLDDQNGDVFAELSIAGAQEPTNSLEPSRQKQQRQSSLLPPSSPVQIDEKTDGFPFVDRRGSDFAQVPAQEAQDRHDTVGAHELHQTAFDSQEKFKSFDNESKNSCLQAGDLSFIESIAIGARPNDSYSHFRHADRRKSDNSQSISYHHGGKFNYTRERRSKSDATIKTVQGAASASHHDVPIGRVSNVSFDKQRQESPYESYENPSSYRKLSRSCEGKADKFVAGDAGSALDEGPIHRVNGISRYGNSRAADTMERARRWLNGNPRKVSLGSNHTLQQRAHDGCFHVEQLTKTIAQLLEELEASKSALEKAKSETMYVRRQASASEKELRFELDTCKARFARAREETIRLINGAKDLISTEHL